MLVNASNKLVLIRGLPGSGKSTLAKRMCDYIHYEADMYFEQESGYAYDAAKISEAHQWCQKKTMEALQAGSNVVVSNTFVCIWEMEIYIQMGFPTRIIEQHGKWASIHHVSTQTVSDMEDKWEKIPQDLI
ncbi:MAG: ATP-binding protein [Ghiorsea sp.]|nr:ATP-binding protein [Ghiorsea sp.]